MTSKLLMGILGALSGLGLGALQYRLLKRLLPTDGQFRAAWLLPVKFLLWAAAMLLGLWIGPVFALTLIGTASMFYVGCAIHIYLRSR